MTRALTKSCCIKRQRYPQICRRCCKGAQHCSTAARELKTLRHHADDGVALAVERDRLSQGIAIGGEAAFPKVVADDYDLIATRLFFFCGEDASLEWSYPQQLK